MSNKDHFYNRDLSWLDFNERVLFQVKNSRNPLLERLRFLAIFTSNLDEFVMKRYGYFKRAVAEGIDYVGNDEVEPGPLSSKVNQKVKEMVLERNRLFSDLRQDLKNESIEICKWSDLNKADIDFCKSYFHEEVFPVLTPLAIDPAHPFPFLSNLSVSLGLVLQRPGESTKDHLARIKIPSILEQWVSLPHSTKQSHRFISLHDVIQHNVEDLFPEMKIKSVIGFRVSRSADGEDSLAEEFSDLVDSVSHQLKQRKFAEVVRVEYFGDPNNPFYKLLLEELELEEEDFMFLDDDTHFETLHDIAGLPFPKLKYESFLPAVPKILSDESVSIFDQIKKQDIFVHHPFESFSASVERFLKDAVEDSSVVAIKLTLYRAGSDSALIPLLIRAAENGKQIVCVVEVKARFDEQQNIYWAELLEEAGVHVVYGVVGLKTHCKSMLVIRKESKGFEFYAHIGTGNYNSKTAKLYTDFGLFTTNRKLTSELVEVFNFLTGLSLKKNYKNLLVSPINMREQFEKLIENEIKNKKEGKRAYIMAKMNSLEDKKIIEKLYKASKSGVKIDLMVRGFCSLKAGVKDLSENIRVTSIVGRFLEHSRSYYFANGSDDHNGAKIYIGSADWMHRNLDNRVEVLTPILDVNVKQLLSNYMELMLQDKSQTWEQLATGDYKLLDNSKVDASIHDYLLSMYKGSHVPTKNKSKKKKKRKSKK
ncbi:MAG: polyphosphate kinase 1 [Bdellovibrionales bacterium]